MGLNKESLIVKIFIPEDLFVKFRNTNSCSVFGEVALEEKSLSYFIISAIDKDSQKFRRLGEITLERRLSHKDIPIVIHPKNDSDLIAQQFYYIYLTNLGITEIENASVNIFIYEENKIVNLNFSWNDEQNDINFLKKLILEKRTFSQQAKNHQWTVMNVFKIFLKITYTIISRLQSISLFEHIFSSTALYDQMTDWKNCMRDLERNENGQLWKLFIDVSAGTIVMLLCLFCIHPEDYFIETSQNVVIYIQTLLESLKGSPVGLKLNKQLNNFLLDCFTYHVNLWAIFLVIISPIIRYLFVPIIVLGFLGLSFQLAMLSDLIVLISLHAHCFYIYAAVLYNIEKIGLSALWKVFLGKRKNILKKRVESYDYMNRQLFLSTMFFTILLFLFPTILVYYTVFASLRVFIYLICYILMRLRKRILEFRVDLFFKLMHGSSLEMEYLKSIQAEHIRNRLPVSVFKLKPAKSSWKYIVLGSYRTTSSSNTYMTLKEFFYGILRGDLIHFSQVKANLD